MYIKRNLNGRFLQNNKSCCSDCESQTIQPINQRFAYTDKVQPINGILENVLGYENQPITTIGMQLETKTILMLAGAVVVAGLIIKNVKISK